VATFFVPGVGDDERAVERAYTDMRRQLELDMGRRPSKRRILQLWTRRGRVDCITEVGRPDPLHGGIVMAIFDMGPHQPFVVWRQPDADAPAGAREILGCSAYSVLEFDL
jgi:hypothetical protein